MSDQRFHVWQRGRNDTAIVFIHGFIGDYLETWKRFPYLVLEDGAVNHCDVICWGYPSNLLRPFFRLPFLGRRLPTLSEVANALRTDLMASEIARDYMDLVLVAHSMGGLVVQKMIVDCLAAVTPNQELLDKIRCLVCYATPTDGVQVRCVAKSHPQLKALAASDEFVASLRQEWTNRVYRTRESDPSGSGRAYIPFTVVAGLEDNVVPFHSVKSVFAQTETAPGSHTSVVKPDTRDHTSFQILKREVTRHTCQELIKKSDDVIATNCEIVRRAADIIFTTGSRSRDDLYLTAIEEKLRANPGLVYIRVLMGPIRKQELKEHLLRVFQFRDPTERLHGRQTLYVGLYNDLATQPEIFLCGNERRCLAILPPLDGVGRYSTARVFTCREEVANYHSLVRDLYGRSVHLENASAITALPVEAAPA
jgi:pimeloyl-ACP methyl ester carboxylesterase